MAESFTVAHASDPHLGHRREADAAENARVVAEAIAADAEVGLVVVAGDLTDDGDRSPEDFGLAQAWLASLGKPWRVAPGNHDVGAFTAVGEGVVTEEACRRFADAFGPASGGDRWADHEAAPGWSLLGVNAMVAGSGLAREKEQQRWLVAQRRVAHQRGHVVGLVTHAPLFVNEPDEALGSVHGYWTALPAARDAMLRPEPAGDLAPLGLVLSGHLHQCRGFEAVLPGHAGATRFAWSPAASGSIVDAPAFPLDEGRRRTGYWRHRLGADGRVDSEFVGVALKTRVYRPTE